MAEELFTQEEQKFLATLDPVTKGKLIQEAQETARASNARRQKIMADHVENRIQGLIDVELENLGKRQGFEPNRKQIMEVCDQVRLSVSGK